MGFVTSWLKRLVCARPKEPLTPTDWRHEHYDEPLNAQDLLDLQETIDSHSGLILLHGQTLRKYEERLARLAKIYKRTATIPFSLEEDEKCTAPRVALESVRGRTALKEELGVMVDSPVTPTTRLELPQQQSPESIETVTEEELTVRPRHLVDDINRLEREAVTSFSPAHLARGTAEAVIASQSLTRKESSRRETEEFPSALLKRTQSIAGTSDFYADEFLTPCDPGSQASDNSIGDASPELELTPRLEDVVSFGIGGTEFQDRQPMHVTFSRDYDVIEGQKPSRPMLSDDPLNEELLFHSEVPPLSPNSETVRKVTSGFYRERFNTSPEWKVKNAIFAAADIRATSDSAGSMWEDDRLTRLIPEKVESSKLVFDKACA